MAEVKCPHNLATDNELVSQLTGRSERNLILKVVRYVAAWCAVPSDIPKIVTVVPKFKWPADLTVTKVSVPEKFGNLRNPAHAERREWEMVET